MISPSRTNKPSSLTHFLYGRGGERAPVALCREPTEPAGETGVGLSI